MLRYNGKFSGIITFPATLVPCGAGIKDSFGSVKGDSISPLLDSLELPGRVQPEAPHFHQDHGPIEVADGERVVAPLASELLPPQGPVVLENRLDATGLLDPGQVGHFMTGAVMGEIKNPLREPFWNDGPF